MAEQITVLDAIGKPPEWWTAHVVTTAHGFEIVCALIHIDDFPGRHRIYTNVAANEYFWEAADTLLTVTPRQTPAAPAEPPELIEAMPHSHRDDIPLNEIIENANAAYGYTLRIVDAIEGVRKG